MRVPSRRPTKNGGFLHKVFFDSASSFRPPKPPRRSDPPQPPRRDLQNMMEKWKEKTPINALQTLADALGVSAYALSALDAARAILLAAWAFPMRDGDGKTVGIRLRGDNGRKWAVKGSKDGLFYPESVPPDHVAFVCEGPTDTAAILSVGLWAVGRPSCMGAVEHVKNLCRRLHITHLVVVADNDAPKQRPDGSWWQPGFDGARKLTATAGLPYKIISTPTKDVRAWVRAGATRDDFNFLTASQNWRFR